MKKMFLCVVALIACISANAQSFSMTINDAEAKDCEMELIVNMENGYGKVISFNFDLYLPECASIATDEQYGDYLVELSSRSQKHNLTTELMSDGGIRFVSYSDKNREYKGTDGAIVIIPLKLNGVVGVYEIEIKNAHLAYAGDSNDIPCENVKATLSIVPTAIKTIAANENKGESYDLLGGYIYDLSGRRATTPTRGIYIKNGKKVLVK